jgi:hypothetical protein
MCWNHAHSAAHPASGFVSSNEFSQQGRRPLSEVLVNSQRDRMYSLHELARFECPVHTEALVVEAFCSVLQKASASMLITPYPLCT